MSQKIIIVIIDSSRCPVNSFTCLFYNGDPLRVATGQKVEARLSGAAVSMSKEYKTGW